MKDNDSRVLFAPGSILPPHNPPIIVADGLRTPENVGALIRLAANVGCQKVVLLGSKENMKLNKIRKTACMAWDYVQLIYADPQEFHSFVPKDYEVVAVETSPSARNIYAQPLPRNVVLVLGSEVYGVSPSVLSQCSQHVFVPMSGPDTSMNVSQAAAVALFEWVRIHYPLL